MFALEHFIEPYLFTSLEDVLPRPTTINSFDCARFSMGVAQVTIDPVLYLPGVYLDGYSVTDRLTILESHVNLISKIVNNLIQVNYIGVWSLGNSDLHDAWDVAPPLKTRLNKMDSKFGVPDVLLYEFQMGANDKSRMVSTMLAYHYCQREGYACKKTVRIPPAVKNTLCPTTLSRNDFETRCPQTAKKRTKNVMTGKLCCVAELIYRGRDQADLSIQTFLAIVTDTYKANKLHTSACLEWWASYFPVNMKWVPSDCLDDAADAFMQIHGAIQRRLI